MQNLSDKYHRSLPWIKKQIFEYEAVEKMHNPREVILVCDATFYVKRKDKLGTFVFKDASTNEILIWKHIEGEKLKDYKYLLHELLSLGYNIKSITIDGKRGLYKLFEDYSVQMCHFHQIRIIQRYITKHPKLEASKELKKIVSTLTKTSDIKFTIRLDNWYDKYEYFLNEKTVNPITREETFTHYRLVAAYKSLRTHLPYLFTCKKYKKIKIPNTTNCLDGGVFSPMKMLIKIHRGLSKSLKLKIVDDYLVSYKKKE